MTAPRLKKARQDRTLNLRRIDDADSATEVRLTESESISVNGEARYLLRVAVRDGMRWRLLPIENVDWIDSARNHARLHVGQQVYQVRATLNAFEAALDPRQFARIHRGCIVNLDRARQIEPWLGGDMVLRLADGQSLRVSRNFRKKLFRQLNAFGLHA